ncbi:hypothetical protein M885DRAFT_510548 [Pelagophyceae sp. CCMP2097]|nr:hypothetical protein M885DRAFT_510548 [Pelagophyceae sp. CCMP2097]
MDGVAVLLSYQGCGAVLARACGELGLEVSKFDIRGRLEDSIPPPLLDRLADAALRDHFAAVLGWTEDARRSRGDAMTRGKALVEHIAASVRASETAHGAPPAETPPRRSLVGHVAHRGNVYDVALAKDVTPGQFSLYLSQAGGKAKVGYALVGIDADGALALRGLHVSETCRGRGVAQLLLLTWLALVAKGLGGPFRGAPRDAARSREIDKPLIAIALQSLGFTPQRKNWQIHVANADAAGGSVVWAADETKDPRAIFSNMLCKSQRITLALPPHRNLPKEFRSTFVKTTFHLSPEGLAALKPAMRNLDATFYSARIVAFAATMGGALLLADGPPPEDGPATTVSPETASDYDADEGRRPAYLCCLGSLECARSWFD